MIGSGGDMKVFWSERPWSARSPPWRSSCCFWPVIDRAFAGLAAVAAGEDGG